MQAYNRVVLAGNLTRDPEMRYTPKGTAVASITLALNHVWTSEGGEKKEEVSFIDCTAWGRTAENLAQYKKKGEAILIEGRLQQQTWEDKQTGAKKSKVVVQVEKVLFLGSGGKREDGGEAEPKKQASGRSWRANAAPPAGEPLEGDGPPESDNVPF